MSANRKLQSEVEKVLKKVEEGVEVFDEIWDKVYAATQQSLKEKYESDLKKEIKKLQRLRDQIKTWQGSNDIKDKTNLNDAKKLIENKMEQFKICEKETKTKAYSKEGLAREEKLDPHEIEKEESRAWVQSIIERIENFVESWEADIERISNAKGKNKNKDQLLRLDTKVTKNRWHVKMLEQINRLIDNDSLEVEKLNDIKEDIDYFVECMENDDCDGIDDDYNIYEDLQLDSLSGGGASRSQDTEKSVETSSSSATSSSSSSTTSSSTKASATITASGTAIVGGVAIGKKTIPSNASTASILASISPSKTSKTSKATAKASTKAATTTTTTTTTTTATATSAPTSTASTEVTGSTSAWANAAKPNVATTAAGAVTKAVSEPPATTQPVSKVNGKVSSPTVSTIPAAVTPVVPVKAKTVVSSEPQSLVPSPPLFDDSSSSQLANGSVLSRTSTPSGINSVVGGATKGSEVVSDQQQSNKVAPFMQQFSSQQTTSINQQQLPNGSPSILSGANEPPSKTQQMPLFGNSQEMQSIASMLKSSMMHTPPVNDVAADHRHKGFTPKNPYNSHPSFPTQQPAVFENPAIFERLPMDSLFLAFYYQQGSYQQYLAARQLKKNSWRFHKKYMTWFQRHEEPKVTTDEYEQGTYVYFDYESGWCQRIKSEFKFEYAYLEDELSQAQNA